MRSLSAIVAGLWRLADWNLDSKGLANWMHACLEMGISSMDLAEVYGGHTCEQRVGDAFRASPGLRQELQVITKFGIQAPGPARPEIRRHHYDASAHQLRRSVERALKELGVEQIDAILVHRADILLDADELAACVDDLVEKGKIAAFGVSNFTPSQVEMISARMGAIPFANQVETSVLCLDAFQNGTLDQAQRMGIPIMGWSPLAGGRLFGQQDAHSMRVIQALDKAGNDYGTTRDVMAYAFLLRHPANIHPITGSGQLDRLSSAREALGMQLDRETWYDIWTASTNQALE